LIIGDTQYIINMSQNHSCYWIYYISVYEILETRAYLQIMHTIILSLRNQVNCYLCQLIIISICIYKYYNIHILFFNILIYTPLTRLMFDQTKYIMVHRDKINWWVYFLNIYRREILENAILTSTQTSKNNDYKVRSSNDVNGKISYSFSTNARITQYCLTR